MPTRAHWNTFPCPDAFETWGVAVTRHTAKLVLHGMRENGLADQRCDSCRKHAVIRCFLAQISKRSKRNPFPCPYAFETRRLVVPGHTAKLVLLGMGENGLAGPTLRFLPKQKHTVIRCFWRGFRNAQTGIPSCAQTPLKLGW